MADLAIERVIRNKFGKRCATCNKWVEVDKGWSAKTNEGWKTYCDAHLPGRKPVIAVTRRLTEDGYIDAPFDREELPLVRSFPGAWFSSERKQWKFSLKLADRHRVLELAEQLGYDVPAALREIEKTEQAKHAATIVVNGKSPYPFQVTGIEWLSRQERALLGDSMGLGKSMQSLLALGKDERVIVLCPAGLKYNWFDEIKQWRPDYKIVVLEGLESFKIPEPGEIVILNFRILPEWLEPRKPGILSKEELKVKEEKIRAEAAEFAKRYPEEQRLAVSKNTASFRIKEFKDTQKNIKKDKKIRPVSRVPQEIAAALADVTLITDEAHNFRNFDSMQTIKGAELSRLCKKVWFLTGTPLLNRPNQLWSVLNAGGMAWKVFGSWNKFIELFNARKNEYNGWEWGTPDTTVPERLRRVMLRRRREEVLPDLPRKTYSTIRLGVISADLQRRLDRLYEEYAGYFEASDELPPFEEFSEIRAELSASRWDAVQEFVEDHEESETPIVVASAHRFCIDKLGRREGWATITGDTSPLDRQAIVRRFQAGELKGVALTIQAGGVGLTLTRAWKMLFVDLDWTPALNSQCEDRICIRHGQFVPTLRGVLPIEQVDRGDYVLGKSGRWCLVKEAWSRQHRGLMTEIKYTRHKDPLVSTHDHQILVRRKSSSTNEWVQAHSVLPGDFLVLPKYKVGDGLSSIDFPKESRFPYSCSEEGEINGRSKPLPETILVDGMLMFIFGWYLAEGFCSTVEGKGRFVSFSGHGVKEETILRMIGRYFKHKFGIESHLTLDGNKGELRCYSADLAYFFHHLFGTGARNKRISDVLLKSIDIKQVEIFLSGYFKGDGYKRNRQQEWTSVSVHLMYTIGLLVTALDFCPSVRDHSSEGALVGGFTKDGNPSNKGLNFTDDNFIFHPVREVRTRFGKRGIEKDMVRDLTVDGDESFVVGLATVHNCRIGQLADKVEIVRMVCNHPLDLHIHRLLDYKIALINAAVEATIQITPKNLEGSAGETEEEYQTRMAEIERIAAQRQAEDAERERAAVLSDKERTDERARLILERERSKGGRLEVELTEERCGVIREALHAMLSVCDGAFQRDAQGFNKPDSGIARFLSFTGLTDPLHLRVAERILSRYYRQLHARFPSIFDHSGVITVPQPVAAPVEKNDPNSRFQIDFDSLEEE